MSIDLPIILREKKPKNAIYILYLHIYVHVDVGIVLGIGDSSQGLTMNSPARPSND